MPRQSRKSSLMSKIEKKGRAAHAAHRSDEATYSGGADLPAGIEGGIAQLVECKFGTFERGNNQGEPYFLAAGIVKHPQELGGIPLEGLRTQIGPEPLCDTPEALGKRKTFDDHYAWVLNQLRILGVETAEMEFDDLEETVEALKEDQPHFRFRTWQGQATEQFPNPRVQHDWRGHCDYVEGGEDGVVDETEDDNASPEATEEETLNDLAAAAEDGNVDAMERLGAAAKEVGIEPDDIETWQEVVDAIRGADDPGADDEPGVNAPKKGEVAFYKPPRARKRVECTIVAVFEGRETCTLKSLDDGKTYKAVPWSKLEEK